jgi:hypothetical protein
MAACVLLESDFRFGQRAIPVRLEQNVGPFDLTRFVSNIQRVIPSNLSEDLNPIARIIAPLISQPPLADGGMPEEGRWTVPINFLNAKLRLVSISGHASGHPAVIRILRIAGEQIGEGSRGFVLATGEIHERRAIKIVEFPALALDLTAQQIPM